MLDKLKDMKDLMKKAKDIAEAGAMGGLWSTLVLRQVASEANAPLVGKTHKNPDSFGRYLAIAYICGDVDEGAENVNQWMLDEGYAVSYVKRSKRKKP